jgi:hypothetical protein
LFTDGLLDTGFQSVPEKEILAELKRYREFVLANQSKLLDEISRRSSNLRIFSGLDRVRLSHLKQSALYVHQYIIDDPLIPLTSEQTDVAEVFGKAIGLSPSTLDKADLTRRLRFLKRLTPMVAADFVKLLPVSTAFEPSKEIPLFYSENRFSDGLPRTLMEKLHARADVRSMRKSGNGYLITDELYPCRQIHVGFQWHPTEDGRMYSLFDVASMTEHGENKFGIHMTVPDAPPDLPYFQTWVEQSVNRTGIAVHDQLVNELAFASALDAVYSTRSELVADLLETVVTAPNTIPVNTANVFLNMELPFLDGVDENTLMRIRTEEGTAFENFRIALDGKLRDLRGVDDPDEARIRAENAVHELTEVQVNDVKNKLVSVKEKATLSAALASVGLMASVQTAGMSLLTTAAAVLKGAEAALDYRQDVKRHPAFFLWKLKDKAKL